MNQTQSTPRLPWQDRWQQPSLEQLTEPLSEQQQRIIHRLIEGIDSFEGIERHFAWHGRSWKWTIQCDLYDAQGEPIGPLVYLVPNPDALEFCMPLKEDTIHQINLKPCNRFVRDGVRAAKCAVTMHWAIFHPTAVTEADHLLDLVNRVHKVLRPKQ
jgi:hypothetical protein